ncbi:hypothetical protein XIS1_450022 [Xenorhabdus innexi]|uniref:Uncharacterized protein n=1 Tax=Xenorhabdus innexi TaxID=290109 RepID=A0A1N6MXQ9_9GAMM|nr:hypothetical protein XIS1_450022 [Xenorhabdus innexi]
MSIKCFLSTLSVDKVVDKNVDRQAIQCGMEGREKFIDCSKLDQKSKRETKVLFKVNMS